MYNNILKTVTISSLALSVSCDSGNPSGQSAEKDTAEQETYQNIVFIIGDDHANHALGIYGNEIVKTPNLDRLAKNGTYFTNAYCNSPICSASRQSILTGRYPHATGVNLLSTPFPEEQVTIADHLSAHGYITGVVGKTHFNNDLSHGFQEVLGKDYRQFLKTVNEPELADSIKVRPPWTNHAPAEEWLNAASATSGHIDKYDQGTYYATQAIDFIQRHQKEKFCLWIGFHEPHAPFNFPVEYRGKYNPVSQLPYPQGTPEDDAHVPEIFRDMKKQDELGVIRSYYTSVEYLDKNIGLITDAIKDLRLDNNTLVVYIGDHGYMLHHHKRFEKHSMWEEAVNSPLVFSGFGNNRDINELIEYIDLVPTLLDIIGVEPMPTAQGKSFLPLLNGKAENHRDYVFCEFLPDNKAMVRTANWKLIFTSGKKDLALGYQTGYGAPGLHYRLYDMQIDPKETHNLANDNSFKHIVDSLKVIMLDRFMQTHPEANKIQDDLSIDQKLSWFCEPLDVGHKGY